MSPQLVHARDAMNVTLKYKFIIFSYEIFSCGA